MVIQLSLQENKLNEYLYAIVLCAGQGLRLNDITQTIPKPLIKLKYVNNKSILEDTIHKLLQLNLKKIVIVKGHLGFKIEDFLIKYKNQNKSIKDCLISIDSEEKYKLGPLFSFLSITNHRNIYNEGNLYLTFPGDTIFQLKLLKTVFNFLRKNIDTVRTIPLLFFREIKVDVLIKNQNLKQISTISTRKKENNLYLEEINQCNLEELSKSDFVTQIIPIFFIPFEFIKLMKCNVKNLSYNTLREFFNHSAKDNKDILAVKINKNLNFYDIDYKEDISNLEFLNQD